MISDSLRVANEQVSRERWWREPAVQRELRLTAAQARKLDALFEHGLDERSARHRTIVEMDRLLERTMERGNADEDSVERLSERVEALRAQENVRHTLLVFAMYRTLSREQRATFASLRRAATSPAYPPDRESPPHRD